jgi:hypothetical protein
MVPLASARERGAIGCASRVAGAAHQISILSHPLVVLRLFTDTRDGALAAGPVMHALDTLLVPVADGARSPSQGQGTCLQWGSATDSHQSVRYRTQTPKLPSPDTASFQPADVM